MLTIVWDVDDVLNDLMLQWFTYCWLRDRPGCTLKYGELTSNPPHAVLGISRDAYLSSLDEFRKTNRAVEMKPNGAVLEWMKQHGEKFRHIALNRAPSRFRTQRC